MISTSSKKIFVNNKCSTIIPQPLCCLAIVIPCGTHPVIKWLITFLFFGLCLSLRQHNHSLWDGLFNSFFLFPKWKSTLTFIISQVMRPFHKTLVMQHICLFPREWLFIFLLIPWMKVFLAFSIPQVNITISQRNL
jgi:hypothetical protein